MSEYQSSAHSSNTLPENIRQSINSTLSSQCRDMRWTVVENLKASLQRYEQPSTSELVSTSHVPRSVSAESFLGAQCSHTNRWRRLRAKKVFCCVYILFCFIFLIGRISNFDFWFYLLGLCSLHMLSMWS